MNFKAIALVILFLVYLWNQFLNLLKWRSAKNPIPKNVADVYDAETYKKWRAYNGEKSRLALLEGTVTFIVDALLVAFNVYAAFARLFPNGLWMQMLSVLLLSQIVSVFAIPFSYYNTMVIEEKYGFNRSTKKTFWLDQVKTFLISLVVMLIVGSLLLWLHQSLGDWLILAFAIVMTLLLLGISFLYPFFSRIFNKFTPLEDGELKEKITGLLEKNGYKVRAIQVMDASKRSTKSNAHFTGFGKMKTIVLYDTLVQSMTTDEICAVFAHEMGHGLHKDTLKNQILSFVQMLILGVLAWLTLRELRLCDLPDHGRGICPHRPAVRAAGECVLPEGGIPRRRPSGEGGLRGFPCQCPQKAGEGKLCRPVAPSPAGEAGIFPSHIEPANRSD